MCEKKTTSSDIPRPQDAAQGCRDFPRGEELVETREGVQAAGK